MVEDNRKFRKTVNPIFLVNVIIFKKIYLINNDPKTTKNEALAKTFTEFFSGNLKNIWDR